MIGYFSGQAVQLRAGNRGQATALFLVVAATLLVVTFASIRLHHVAVAKVTMADSVDAIVSVGRDLGGAVPEPDRRAE